MILGLPDSQYVKRLKDMWLHWWDLNEAKQSLESMNSNNSDVVNRALAQNSIVVFYKCFGKSEFRDNSLKRNKILANFPPEAKKVFDFYKDLRDKFIVHDESRLSQALAGVILQSNKEHPFVDTLGTVAIAERFKSPEELKGFVTTARVPMIAPSPMVTPDRITASYPIHTSLPMIISPLLSHALVMFWTSSPHSSKKIGNG